MFRKSVPLSKCVMILALALLYTLGLRAQNPASLAGKVTDAGGDYPRFTGLPCANMNKFDHIPGVILSGKTGLYKADGNHVMNAVDASNFMDYIGYVPDTNKSKLTNISYQQ